MRNIRKVITAASTGFVKNTRVVINELRGIGNALVASADRVSDEVMSNFVGLFIISPYH